jgi:NAD(P)-dependent dehydrogenase (short-subunit alcohol dehydrogenase family)
VRLAGKVAIVTGGAAGLGLAYARRFVAEGARVVIGDVADAAEALKRLNAPDALHAVRTDVSVFADCERLVSEARAADTTTADTPSASA